MLSNSNNQYFSSEDPISNILRKKSQEYASYLFNFFKDTIYSEIQALQSVINVTVKFTEFTQELYSNHLKRELEYDSEFLPIGSHIHTLVSNLYEEIHGEEDLALELLSIKKKHELEEDDDDTLEALYNKNLNYLLKINFY